MRLVFSIMSKEKSNVVLNSVLLTAAQKLQDSIFYENPEHYRDAIEECVMDLMHTTFADNQDYRGSAILAMNAIKEMADICIVLDEDIKACKGV